MTTPIWQQLISLVSFDQQCQAINKKIIKLEEDILIREQDIKRLEEEMSKQSQQVDALERVVHNTEAALLEITKRQDELKLRSDLARHHKEFTAYEREVATLGAAYKAQEDALIRAWHELEQAQKRLKENVIKHDELIASKETDIAALKDQIATQAQELSKLEAAQDEQMKSLPPEWQTKYRQLRGKVSNPIVPLLHESCSVCYYHALPADVARIKRGAVIQCLNCYRMLYFDRGVQKAEDTASY